MQLDTSEKGLESVFKGWHLAALDPLFEGKEVNSRDAWIHVNTESEWGKQEDNSISRASIIFFFNRLADEEGLITYREKSGKGGYHRVYSMEIGRQEFVKQIIEQFVGKLDEIIEVENIGQVLSLLEPIRK